MWEDNQWLMLPLAREPKPKSSAKVKQDKYLVVKSL